MRLSGRRTSADTRRWSPPQQVALFSLIALNVAVFAAQLALEAARPGVISEYLGLSYLGLDRAYAWQFFSAMFLHAGIINFLAAMLLLYFVGRDLAVILGQKHFLYLYLAGIIGGELGHLFLMPGTTVLLAAGGGAAAAVVAFATVLPELELSGTIFFLPLRLKTKHLGCGLFGLAVVAIMIDRHGVVGHSAWLGGCAAGWLYARLLGFGQPLFIQRSLRRRHLALERRRQMSAQQFIAEEIDPLLEKIARSGLGSLRRRERRLLCEARERMTERPQ